MANSRSNIYPVQLQGAELNLNKFDAEIKQYSGFNKNNSPFVGGCLSNLFTKTEENTTGSSESVYVDDNGDVYSIEGGESLNWRLEKKDAKTGEVTVLNQWENTKVINVKELSYLPEDTVYYFEAPGNKGEIWITVNINYVELHYKKGTYETTFSFDGVYLDYVSFDFLFNADVFNNKVYISCAFAYMHNSGIFSSSRLFSLDLSSSEPSFSLIHSLDDINTFNTLLYLSKNSCFLFDSNLNRLYYIINRSIPMAYIFDSTDQLLASQEVSDIISIPASLHVNDFELISFFITKELKPYLSGCVYKVYIVKATQKNSTSHGKFYPVLDVETVGDTDPSIYKIKVKKGDSAFVEVGTTEINRKGISISNYEHKYCLQNYGVSYGLLVGTNDNKYLTFGVVDSYVTQNVSLGRDKNDNIIGRLEAGSVISGMVLFNNGVATGICSPGGVLLTEWNTVDKNFIFPQNNGLLAWKNIKTNKVYILELKETEEDIWLKNVNGQLVVNLDVYNNAYDLREQKNKAFAFAWNNRAFFRSDELLLADVKTDGTEVFFASSVNEYNLKDNASILLNPIPVVNFMLTPTNNYNEIGAILNNFYVNYYFGSEEAIYKASLRISNDMTTTRKYFYSLNQDLIGLPFPINTSGNVQLSPSLFCKTERFGNDVFIKEGSNAYQLIKEGSESVMSYYLSTLIENLEDIFILQGQYYAIINKQIFNVQFSGGVVQSLSFVVSVENLQFCGNSAYQAYFFSKTNRCIYVFTGANILNQLQLVDKISEIYAYKYNQSTQSIILITDLGTIVSSNLGMYLIEGFTPDDVFFYDKGVVFVSDSELTYLQYYEADGFEKHNIEVETCFYGMNNETVTINDCLYIRLFSEEHEEGEVKVSATTISLKGRKTETTVFKFKASDWDALTHSVYVRYQPKEQRGLGISFSIDSPFKIASLSVGSKADAILVDKVSKGAVITPSNNDEW